MANSAIRRAVTTALLASTLGGLAPVGAALAQSEAKPGVLEEIVVTARKREESLQNVAMAVSAFGQASIDSRFATKHSDVSNAA